MAHMYDTNLDKNNANFVPLTPVNSPLSDLEQLVIKRAVITK